MLTNALATKAILTFIWMSDFGVTVTKKLYQSKNIKATSLDTLATSHAKMGIQQNIRSSAITHFLLLGLSC
jgi:hypothetical protein